MKKQLILNSLAVFIAALLLSRIDYLLSLSWNWGVILFALPIMAGIISALIQDGDRSYQYLPKIIIGALFFSFLTIFFAKLFSFILEPEHVNPANYFNPFKDKDELYGHLGLATAYLAGGLVGIFIRGVNLIFFPKHNTRLNLNISFLKSVILSSLIVLSANYHYVMNHVPPDGRWKFELPATSAFIAVYLILFIFTSKKLLKNPRLNYLMWTYNAVLSLIFLSWAMSIQVIFQDVSPLYFRYIATAPYLIVFGLGIIFYALLLLIKQSDNKNTL
ncbi:MAG: hypothetical protein WC745_03210 [Patescibacteria group bacterium]|jgi:hypothetical protein